MEVTPLGTAVDLNSNARVEALKMAYEIALKTDEINSRQRPEDRYDSLKGVMELAELNYQFIMGSKLTW